MSNTAYKQYVQDLKGAWKDGVCVCSPDGACTCGADAAQKGRVLPDGHRMTVAMNALDSVQTAVADQTVVDERVQHNLDAGNARLTQMARDNERVAGMADGYTALREQREQEARDENPAYASYVASLNDAWQNPPNAAGGVS